MADTGACAGVGLTASIEGSPDDPSVAWLRTMGPEHLRLEAIWPDGFRAVFDPTMTIVDGAGRPQLRQGDFIDGGCVTGTDPQSAPLLLIPPFLGVHLECGPVEVFTCSELLNAAARSDSWPSAPIDTVRVLDAAGDYEILLEDGRRVFGRVSAGSL